MTGPTQLRARPRRPFAVVVAGTVAGVCGAIGLAACSGGGSPAAAPPVTSAPPVTTMPPTTAPPVTTSPPVTAAPSATAALPALLVEPDDGYAPVDAFIASARRSVDMTMYELSDPTAEAALEADAARGVAVRVLLDSDYGGRTTNAGAATELAAHGVQVAWASGSEIFHQKTVTVDGSASLIMTGNLVAADEASTRDFAVTDTDPADVAAIESVFAVDLAGGTPAPGPPATDLVWSPGAASALVGLITSARSSVVTESEEMDSTPVEDALEADARRGVTVDVVMTYSSSWSAAFDRLTAAGVHVVVYHGETPLYIHAKAILVDGGTAAPRAFVGSQNYSTASLDYNRELGTVTTAPSVTGPLGTTLAADVRGGTPWT